MQKAFVLLAVTVTHVFGAPKECNDGIILVGGVTPSGPSLKVNLLKENGMCEQSGFPDLPEPLTSPGAYFKKSDLLVCGFSGMSPCKYTQRGWSTWKDIYGASSEYSHFKMAYSTKVGSVMMTSRPKNSTISNYIQHNPVVHNSGNSGNVPPITSWMQIMGSPFTLGTEGNTFPRDISNSCLSSFDGDLLLTGGSESERCTRCSSRGSQPFVGRWSIAGRADGMGPPEFENGVVPNMNEAREAHSCAEFDGGVVVSGGFHESQYQGPNGGPPLETFELKNSAEFYDGTQWITMQNMNTPRAFFQLQPMCGAVVAIGGESRLNAETVGTFLETVEQAWSVYGEWIPAAHLDLPEPLAYAASSSVSGLDCWTGK